MFTGLIEEVGRTQALGRTGGNIRLTIAAPLVTDGMRPGDSVSLQGVCLTATTIGGALLTVDATTHTLAHSTLGDLQVGGKVNLERALKLGDRFGGHIVQGHIDGIGRISRIHYGEGSTDLHVEMPPELLKLMAPQGSVALDGVSLTIAEKSARGIRVMLVPFTLAHTTLGELTPGARVNIESDLVIRWLADHFRDGEVTSAGGVRDAGWGAFHLED